MYNHHYNIACTVYVCHKNVTLEKRLPICIDILGQGFTEDQDKEKDKTPRITDEG